MTCHPSPVTTQFLTATGTARPPSVTEAVESIARAEIHDAEGGLVADADVTWRLSPVPGPGRGP